jgi:hypothetical protein
MLELQCPFIAIRTVVLRSTLGFIYGIVIYVVSKTLRNMLHR